jgi:hypothetical protein
MMWKVKKCWIILPLHAIMKIDFVDNIEEFIHVGKRNWDVIGYDGDPIYDIEGHVQKLPLPLSHEVTNKFDIWQQGHDMITILSNTQG